MQCKICVKNSFETVFVLVSKSIITISSYTVSKLGRFFETQCIMQCKICVKNSFETVSVLVFCPSTGDSNVSGS